MRPPLRLERLLQLVAQGDRAAFGRLYDLTSPAMFAILRAETRDADAAEETLLSTYVALWAEGARYPADHPGAWWLLSHLHQEIERRRARPGGTTAERS